MPATPLTDTAPAPAGFAVWRPDPTQRLGGEAAVGAAVEAAWADAGGPPACAVVTHFALLEGGCAPAAWSAALGTGPLLLADRDDLMGLPAARLAWGERAIPGATVALPPPGAPAGATAHDVVLVARTAGGYAALCRYLSARHEDPDGAGSWPWGWGRRPDLEGVVALVRDHELGRHCAQAQATVAWRLDLDDGDSGPLPWPAALVPRLGFVHASDRATTSPLLARLRRQALPLLAAAEDLVAARSAWRGREALVGAGRELIASCAFRPSGALQMPPSRHPDATGELRRRALSGAHERYGNPLPDAVRQRLEHELAVITLKQFDGYILTVADLAAGRRTCGRGSAASSLVVHCLGLTAVDPVRWNLLFERFLNPARTDPPDIDLDFPWDERDAVLAAAISTYGRDHVAMVATHLHLKRWSALRLVARCQRRDPQAVSALQRGLRARERYGVPTAAAGWEGDLEAAARLVGMPHHRGLHCGGVVITPGPIRDLVPIHPATKEILVDPDGDHHDPEHLGARQPIPTIAWEKDGAEAMGLVKIDLLGNRSLAVIRDCLADLAEDGIRIDEARWRPADDPATQRLLANGRTLGCFYIESPAMRLLQARAGSGDFDRLVVHSSIIRPAAQAWIHTYLERLHHHRATGRIEDAWYPHPALRELLSTSYGILSYQEDVMLVAMRLAGFDDRQANALRKALGHWDTGSRLTRFADEFRAGCTRRQIAPAVIDQVWAMISSFAGYSFAKAHSASYAMVSVQCAWLKAHHPAYFLARVVANEGGFYAPSAYLAEARRLGVAVHRPCVLASAWRTVRSGAGAIRCGLHLVPGLAAATAARIVAERTDRPFAGIADLRRRSGIDGRALVTLARAGGLDALRPDLNLAQRIWVAEAVAALPGPRRLRAAEAGLVWFMADAGADVDPTPPALPAPDERAVAREHWLALGILPEAHPIWFAHRPARRIRCMDITPTWAGRRLSVYVWPVTRRQVDAQPRAGGPAEPMAFVTGEDETGLIETVWFPATYRACGILLERDQPLRLDGVVEVAFGVATLSVTRAEAISVNG